MSHFMVSLSSICLRHSFMIVSAPNISSKRYMYFIDKSFSAVYEWFVLQIILHGFLNDANFNHIFKFLPFTLLHIIFIWSPLLHLFYHHTSIPPTHFTINFNTNSSCFHHLYDTQTPPYKTSPIPQINTSPKITIHYKSTHPTTIVPTNPTNNRFAYLVFATEETKKAAIEASVERRLSLCGHKIILLAYKTPVHAIPRSRTMLISFTCVHFNSEFIFTKSSVN